MSEHHLEKLLGGFAADTLTAEERNLLYTAALNDQQLFNALADEQALKELLSDPDVRRRLLDSLVQTGTPGTDDPLSWLDWLRRPAGLAFAGGLSAAALALVLGIRIYQDSLRQAAQSTATEEVTTATPQANELQATTEEHGAPAIGLQEHGTLFGKLAKPERDASPPSKQERASDAARDSLQRRSDEDKSRREAQPPPAAEKKATEQATPSSDQAFTASSAPPDSMPKPEQLPLPAVGRATDTTALTLSARALFYGEKPSRGSGRSMATEQEQALKPPAEPAPQANRLERSLEGDSLLGDRTDTVSRLRPLGLRYSFVVQGQNGQDQEVDATTASMSRGPVRLTIETNQDAYLQVWQTVGSSPPLLLWPKKETGQISVKISAGQRQQIPLPMDSRSLTLTAHISRVPSGLIAGQEPPLLKRFSPDQLQESITPSGTSKSHERATYIVTRDASTTAQLVVSMTLDR